MKKINLALISDLHNKEWPIFKKADVLIFAGDFTNADAKDMLSQVFQFEKAMESLKSQADKFKQIIIVFGNHDTFANFNPKHNKIIKWEVEFAKIGTKLRFLTNDFLKFDDFLFYGSPFNQETPSWKERKEKSPWAFHWDEKKEVQVKRLFNNTNIENIDVMITHPPKYNYLDSFFGKPSGDKRATYIYGDIKPKLWVSGHIHEGYGVLKEGETTYVNASYSKSHFLKNMENETNSVIYLTIEK